MHRNAVDDVINNNLYFLCQFLTPDSPIMSTTKIPQKRILGEASSARRNIPSSPSSGKKRKLEALSSPVSRFKSSQYGQNVKLGSSQPSHFESEVLEKMTQDMAGLKKNNSEKDQEWQRPPLIDFQPERDNLCFQQIDAEEGTLNGGKATVKFFGVTEVCGINNLWCYADRCRLDIP